MKVAVLAVQGAFIEHEKALERLGVETVELRKAEDLEQDFDGLVLPGGESTVQSRLLKELSMFEPLKKKNRRRSSGFGYLCRSYFTGAEYFKR